MSTPDERGITRDRWQRIEALYHEMLGRPEDARRPALVRACAGDRALQAEVELLLAQAASAAGHLIATTNNC